MLTLKIDMFQGKIIYNKEIYLEVLLHACSVVLNFTNNQAIYICQGVSKTKQEHILCGKNSLNVSFFN
jgi:hypothetical protein